MGGATNFRAGIPDPDTAIADLLYKPIFGSRFVSVPPPQWLAGLIGFVFAPIFWRSVTILPPNDTPNPLPSTALIDEVLEKLKPDGIFTVPSMIRDLCLGSESLARLRSLKWVSWAGARLDDWAGDLLCEHVEMTSLLGSTDGGLYFLSCDTEDDQPRDPKEWNYLRFNWRLGAVMEPAGEKNLHELVLHRDPSLKRYQAPFWILPEEVTTFRSKDLYEPHPSKPNLWRYVHRADDLFKNAWLAKVKAEDVEHALERRKEIASALIGGEARSSPFVIIEPRTREGKTAEELKVEIWEAVQAVNETMVAEVKVPEANIIVADPKRPLEKLHKGTLNRRGILAAYEKDIDRLYA
jgi:acyl-coenzyme A synthetase/AMP-(fatty) acid ligase